MEQLFPGLESLQWDNAYLTNAREWLMAHVIQWGSLGQVITLLGLWQLARIFARRSAVWFEDKVTLRERKIYLRVNASNSELFFLLYFVVLLWGTSLIAESAGLPFGLLWTATSLFFAWGVIRFTSSTIKSPFWSRIIAVTLWTLAAINILGLLGTTVELLDKAAITVGDFRFSLLILVKSLLAFGVLMWVVSFISSAMDRAFEKSESLTPSQRVLFQKLAHISLFALAGVIGLHIVGLDLTALTVFSGALGLGIGFGLQKIFSNLISGFILLLDKSVKPGDVIAVGDTFGWVNSLGARCVSVITRDGKEHLIPNENLIIEEVENWSYSDHNVRVHIPIGVAYHSDIKLVKELLKTAVTEHPRILPSPEPIVCITGFGDSSVDHEIRAWISDPANGITNVTSDIYYRVWDLFMENGVQIPFPQRDLNINPNDMDKLAELLKKR